MKKMKTKNKCLVTSLAILAMLMMSLGVKAQNVTISPKSGSLVSGEMDGHDTGYAIGLSSMWQHEQLSLTMTASDRDGLTDAGEISKPGSVLGIRDFGTADKPNKMLTIIGGNRPSFLVVSLPKGYRITGYRLTLINNLVGANVVPPVLPQGASQPDGNYRNLNNNTNHLNSDVNIMRFYETKPWTTDGTNSGCTGRQNGEGYNSTQVRYIALGSDWANGQIGTTADEVLAQAKNGNDGDINPTDAGKEFYMERFGDDMGNQLYFRLVKNYSHYGLSIKSFEILFTAEGTFEADVTPEVVGHAQHVVQSPFLTSKMDIGEMSLNTDPNTHAQRYTYNENNVKDIVAYTYLYQQGAVKNGKPSEDVDIPARINPVRVDDRDLYALGNDTYFIETPVEVETQSGWPAPIGYRIVGATFNYLWGTEVPGKEIEVPDAVYITYSYRLNNGRTATRYLNDELHFQEAQNNNNNNPYWQVDKYGNIYRGSGNNISYLSCYGSDENTRVLHTSKAATGPAAKWNLRLDTDNNRIYYEDSHGDRYYMQGQTNNNTVNVVKNATSSLASFSKPSTSTGNHIVHVSGYHPGAYTLKVYDKEGNYAEDTDGNPTKGKKAVVSSESDAGGILELKGLNNDAVKFAIEGLTEDDPNTDADESTHALVSVTLQMQALDPYIDKMDIICTDNNNVLELRQEFTANDFSVSGGKFIFYVPKDYAGQELTFTFKDLYSKYGDNTYYDGTRTGYSRYSYVTSEYFEDVDGYGDNGLYNNPNYSPDAPYENKVLTTVAGNIRFKFNNAEDLGKPGAQNFLIENPFSVANYLNTTDPDFDSEENPGGTAEPAAFIPCKLKAVANVDQSSDIFYVFTADETRWNIAPTTAWQHRSYAFYRMDIELRAKTFTPVITPTKIYEKTFYTKAGSDTEDSMWGVLLETTDPDDNDKKIEGYLSIQEILDHIKGRAASEDGDDAITGILDENGKNGPKSMEEILYIDGTKLKSILNSSKKETGSDTYTVLNLQTLRNEMAANGLIFLPENTTSTLDNVAYKTSGITFHAGKDIVLTDKQPFFSPYQIQVDPANKATYSREVSGPTSNLVKHATVVLPFTLTVDNGLHENETNDGFAFNLRTLKKLVESPSDNNYYSDADGYFDTFDNTKTETMANQPYMVEVVRGTDENYSFIATEYGAKIVPTPTRPEESSEDIAAKGIGIKNFKSEIEVNVDGLTSYGTYSGSKVDKTENIYYFNKDKFYCSSTLSPKYDVVNVRPFRAYYSPSDPDVVSALAKITGFNIIYDLFSDDGGITTSLTETSKPRVMTITTSKGSMLITATENVPVNIKSVNGLSVDSFNMNAGEQRQVNLPSGIYIVNNTKILVK